MTVAELETGVASSRALLPKPPEYWSYSTLKAVGECPLRYALERSTYPDFWDGHGYPSLPNPKALFGNVVHDALETVVKALTQAGVESPQGVEATDVLRELGGLTSVIDRVIVNQLVPLSANPRLNDDQRQRFARGLRDRTPDARAEVQTYLSRTKFVPGVPLIRSGRIKSPFGQLGAKPRPVLGVGSHAEVQLVADELRLRGRVDFLTVSSSSVDIVDFKTGEEAAGHRDQLRLYGLLWTVDGESNPSRLPVSSLTAAYSDRDVGVDMPTLSELEQLAATLQVAISSADHELLSGAPRSEPSVNNCQRCAVRQLCSAYWRDISPKVSEVKDGDWFDFQGFVGKQHGPHSWWLSSETGHEPELLLRGTRSHQTFAEGDSLRFLGLRLEVDSETGTRTASLTVTTEVFVLASS